MRKNLSQRGFTYEAVIITILVIALIGALGYIFWQNFMNKNQTVDTQNPIVSKVDTPKVQTKTTCLDEEKTCFDYPSDWTVSASVVQAAMGLPAHDKASIKNPTGHQVLVVQSGINGVGGSCGGAPKTSITVVKSEPTKATITVDDSMIDYENSTVNAVQAYYYDPAKGYAPFVYLSNGKDSDGPKTTKTCLPEQSALYPDKNVENGLVSAASVDFFNAFTSRPVDTNSDYFSNYLQTAEQAKSDLSSGDLATAYGILRSIHY